MPIRKVVKFVPSSLGLTHRQSMEEMCARSTSKVIKFVPSSHGLIYRLSMEENVCQINKESRDNSDPSCLLDPIEGSGLPN